MQTDSRARTTGFRAIWDADTERPKRGTLGKVDLADGCHDLFFFVSDATSEMHLCNEWDFIRLIRSMSVWEGQ